MAEPAKRVSSKETNSSQSHKKKQTRSAPRRASREAATPRAKVIISTNPQLRKPPTPAKAPSAEPEEKPPAAPEQPPAGGNAREPRGKKAPPHLQSGCLLIDRLRIERLMGGGGFGQVFKAFDQSTNKAVAIKVEPRDREAGRMILEQKVLALLRGTKHTPKLIASGNHENFMFLAMEMLGRNLGDLRRRQPQKRFSTSSGLRIADQMVEALMDVHSIGFLHRDVKPAKNLPRTIKDIAEHLEKLTYDQTPNYDMIRQILVGALPGGEGVEQPPFEWETAYVSSKSNEMESASNH
ncbi:Protein kinase domain-containing protein [Aphelenchoides fujianensis]|nr:Protein kinase domain-containing protein [Aphelenchoides fujianensis]KAI6242126.1 Protein kinase domain-containing protein [Aphelenchoides fujianensis]